MKYIINADDFGKSEDVNKAIIHCIEERVINSTTIMANGLALPSAATYARSNPQISYGVHLVIDEMESLTKSMILFDNGIIDENGFFIRGAIRNVKIDKALKEAIYTEWCAQVDRLLSLGISINHIDSHHHVHTIPALFGILKRVSQRYNLKTVRNTMWKPITLKLNSPKMNDTKREYCSNNSVSKVSFFAKVRNTILDTYLYFRFKYQFDTTDMFTSVWIFLHNEEKISKCKYVKKIELMCHPGHPSYQKETDALLYSKLLKN